jgi:hypothetical protein
MELPAARYPALYLVLPLVAWPLCAQVAGNRMAVGRESLCVTEGTVENAPKDRLAVNATKMRAYVNGSTSQAIQAHFTYLGPTVEQSKLGSGTTRIQFGLKLRAQDACNLVYAMWRFEPESKIVVSIKRNPSQSKSSECGNRGYQNIKPRRAVAVPVARAGETHTLSAKIDGEDMRVMVDNAEVWDGNLGPEALGLKGPVGIRSDNARLVFDLTAGASAGPHSDSTRACRTGPDASD